MDEDYDQIPSSTADDDLSLPKATVTKMVQEMLPTGISCPRETRDLLLDCCVEFIHLIASESNEICEKSNKKTISPEHVIEALKNLSFDAYIEDVEAEYREHQAQSKSKEKVKGSKLEQSGLTEEELLRQQEELFERARLRMNSTTSGLTEGAGRTAVGSFLGQLSSFSATELGSIAIEAVIKDSRLQVEECLMGNVLSANLGQAPARQAALMSKLPESTTCTTVNKVCASGMKAVLLGAQSIMLGFKNVVVAGGMESMSRAPFYLDSRGSKGFSYGHQKLIDAILMDGLWDPKYQLHMGSCAEETAQKYKISREAQDHYAIKSYERALKADFKNEIVPIKVPKGSLIVSEDEEIKRGNFEKLVKLKPAFKSEDGTITAGNASSLSDGASALLLISDTTAIEKEIKPLARILSFADAECNPKDFPIAPSLAIPLALARAGLTIQDVDLFEINEAFSVVVLANQALLKIDSNRLNVKGGGVSMGHPIGSSGARIIVTLLNSLESGQIGCAAICNGGGGASAILIEKL